MCRTVISVYYYTPNKFPCVSLGWNKACKIPVDNNKEPLRRSGLTGE